MPQTRQTRDKAASLSVSEKRASGTKSLKSRRVHPPRLELFERLFAAHGIAMILSTVRSRGDCPEPRHALRRFHCEDDAADVLIALEHVVIVGGPFAVAAFGNACECQRANRARRSGLSQIPGMIRAPAHARNKKGSILTRGTCDIQSRTLCQLPDMLPDTARRDALAPLHSKTSSAAITKPCGTMRPRALAVLRLMYISTFVDR